MAARRESARRISDCVTALLRDQPFFGSLALRLPIRPDTARETLASDGREIRYSPDWIASTDADLIKTAIARVVLACALKHHTRRSEREPGRWQQASQLVTHGLLRDAGFKLPPDAEAWDGISVEQAYDRLPEPQEGGGQGSDGPPSAGDGGGAGGPQSDAGDDAAGGDDDDDGGPDAASDDGDPRVDDGPGADGPSDAPASCDPSGIFGRRSARAAGPRQRPRHHLRWCLRQRRRTRDPRLPAPLIGAAFLPSAPPVGGPRIGDPRVGGPRVRPAGRLSVHRSHGRPPP